jgi:energy-coupling factor transporter ATP-binding protein EcfA2
MSKIKIKNFGPIKEGYQENDGWIDIKKVTVFIGNQGSGKSTVAKVFSTLSWIEKAMVKGILRQDELSQYNRFSKHLAYQRIEKYIQKDTIIEYSGKAFSFSYNGEFSASKSTSNGYQLPKIMYAPAERNFLSVVDRPDKLKNLPSTLYTFNDEYDTAKNLFADGLKLPINDALFEYDKLNKLAHIVGVDKSYKLRLSEASSGFQSTVPLYLVTKYLSDSLTTEEDPSIKEISLEEQKKLEREMKLILEDKQITPEIRQVYLRQLSARRKPVCLFNIVEEPEQNLFPESQRNVLNELLRYANTTDGNRLIITTHSPYLINFLSIAIQGAYLLKKIKENPDNVIDSGVIYNLTDKTLEDRLNEIVPLNSVVLAEDVVIYELDEVNGTIRKLPSPEGIPSDKNYLNLSIRKGNELFDSLLEIEEEL